MNKIFIKVDENLPVEVVEMFQAAGHDACSVMDQNLEGQPDRVIAEICHSEKRCIVTLDLDFSNIRAYPPWDYNGIIVLRLISQSKRTILQIMPRLLFFLESHEVHGRLWIVEPGRIRIHGAE